MMIEEACPVQIVALPCEICILGSNVASGAKMQTHRTGRVAPQSNRKAVLRGSAYGRRKHQKDGLLISKGAEAFSVGFKLLPCAVVAPGDIGPVKMMREHGREALIADPSIGADKVGQFKDALEIPLKPFTDRFGRRDLPVERVFRQDVSVRRARIEITPEIIKRPMRKPLRVQPA